MLKIVKPISLLLLFLGVSAYSGVAVANTTAAVIESQQNKTVSGIVTDGSEPIIGATVLIQGTSTGSITDHEGKFSFNGVKTGDVIEISFMGYTTQTVAYGGQAVLDIVLEADAQQIDEVVVVGYGTMRKSDVTGSIAVAKGDDMIKSQSFSALDNLRGKASGVNIYSNSGQPGGSTRVIIRGMSTINSSSDPLYVVDGVVMEDFKYMNPNDIESMEVLKDASAAAIYGARGANGVILVTTKRGTKDGKINVTYAGSLSLSTMQNYIDVMNADEYVEAFMIGIENENKWAGYNWSLDKSYWFDDPDFFDANGNPLYDTNWQKEATRTAVSHNHQISIQQGDERSSIGAFLNYTDQQGIILETYQKRISGKVTYDAKPTDWLSTAVNLTVNHSWGQSTDENRAGTSVTRTMSEMLPWLPVTLNGEWVSSQTPNISQLSFESMPNPVHVLNSNPRLNLRTQIFGNAAFTFHLAEGLDLKTQIGIDRHENENKTYSSNTLVSSVNGNASFTNTNTMYWQEETYLTYNKTWGKHRLNGMAGLSWQEREYNYNYQYTSGFSDDFFEWYNMGAGTNPSNPQSSYNRWSMNSYFLRGAYSYDNKYMATVTARVDGSSKFGSNNKYAFFPSLGLGWNISEEDFMEDARNIDMLKLHTSYGVTGNSEIDAYSSLAAVTTSTTVMDGSLVSSSYVNALPNDDLEWEKTAQYDLGVNLIMFRNRLNIDLSFYYKYTTDLLLDTPVPYGSGYTSVMSNIGEVSNKGIDFMVNSTNIDKKDFTWTTTFNLNYNKNRVEALGTNNEDIEPGPSFVSGSNTIIRVGESLGSFYGYERYGVWTEDEADEAAAAGSYVGRPKRSSDKTILGKGLPDFTGSIINNFRYKDFDVTLDFQFVFGVEALQQINHSMVDRFGNGNGLTSVLYDAYDGTNPSTMQPAIYLNNSNHAGQDTQVDSNWVCNGAYLRANLIQFGYNIPSSVCKRWGIANLRAYAGVNNAFVVTSKDFVSYDPEASTDNTNSNAQNIYYFSYPRPRTYTMGVNLTF